MQQNYAVIFLGHFYLGIHFTYIFDKRAIFKMPVFICEICDYITSRRTNFDRHVSTRSHTFLTKRAKNENPYFRCEKCDYITCHKSNYAKHLSTRKHTFLTKVTAASEQEICTGPSVSTHVCSICTKTFNSRQTLHAHRKKCPNLENPPDIIVEILKKNDSLQNIIIEQAKQQEEERLLQRERENQIRDLLIEITKKENTVINNTQTNNNFCLNMFLNEKCKDAMNFVDFVESLHISFEELENMAHKGYVAGMSDIIINGLQQLDVYHRPIHCTDIKRETMYIKDKDEWTKDEDQMKIQKIINMVSKKNMRKVPEWQRAHPMSDITDSKEQYLHINIMQQCLNSGCLSECRRNDAKIIKNIAKFTYLDRGRKIS